MKCKHLRILLFCGLMFNLVSCDRYPKLEHTISDYNNVYVVLPYGGLYAKKYVNLCDDYLSKLDAELNRERCYFFNIFTFNKKTIFSIFIDSDNDCCRFLLCDIENLSYSLIKEYSFSTLVPFSISSEPLLSYEFATYECLIDKQVCVEISVSERLYLETDYSYRLIIDKASYGIVASGEECENYLAGPSDEFDFTSVKYFGYCEEDDFHYVDLTDEFSKLTYDPFNDNYLGPKYIISYDIPYIICLHEKVHYVFEYISNKNAGYSITSYDKAGVSELPVDIIRLYR